MSCSMYNKWIYTSRKGQAEKKTKVTRKLGGGCGGGVYVFRQCVKRCWCGGETGELAGTATAGDQALLYYPPVVVYRGAGTYA